MQVYCPSGCNWRRHLHAAHTNCRFPGRHDAGAGDERPQARHLLCQNTHREKLCQTHARSTHASMATCKRSKHSSTQHTSVILTTSYKHKKMGLITAGLTTQTVHCMQPCAELQGPQQNTSASRLQLGDASLKQWARSAAAEPSAGCSAVWGTRHQT